MGSAVKRLAAGFGGAPAGAMGGLAGKLAPAAGTPISARQIRRLSLASLSGAIGRWRAPLLFSKILILL